MALLDQIEKQLTQLPLRSKMKCWISFCFYGSGCNPHQRRPTPNEVSALKLLSKPWPGSKPSAILKTRLPGKNKYAKIGSSKATAVSLLRHLHTNNQSGYTDLIRMRETYGRFPRTAQRQ